MKKCLYIVFLLIFFVQCRQKYEAVVAAEELNVLVVQGFINSHGRTIINLSRTTKLSDSGIVVEPNALVEIYGDNNSIYPLIETNPGTYISDSLNLESTAKYRLGIKTQGKTYLSDWRQEIKTPEIDSITFTRPNNGIEIYINSRDPQNDTRYYKWNYEESWEIKSEYLTNMTYRIEMTEIGPTFTPYYYFPATREINYGIYRCWKNRTSSAIKIGNTIKLQEDVVYYPIVAYNQGAEELGELYSILVRQQGLSKEGYEFYDKMKKNSESLGSIFDAQPSELKGNIVCQENPKEIIIGFTEVATITERRVFIYNADLPQWNYSLGCYGIVSSPKDNDSMMATFHYGDRALTYGTIEGDTLYGAEKRCVDCTLRGSDTKPTFWPR